jgi:hypothetical protein
MLMVWLAQGAAPGNMLNDSQTWAFIGLGLMILLYVVVARPMMRRKKDPLERPPAFASLSQQRSVERQMQNLLVELSEMARQITAQIDTRSAKLEELIRQADLRIETLKNTRAGDASNEAVESLNSLFTPPPQEPSAIASEPADPQHEQVYVLADQGRDAYEIAAQLGRPRGEVELILALRSK